MAEIVVGFDGSDGARAALEWAMAEAERWATPLTAAVVGPRAVTLGPGLAPMLGAVEQDRLGDIGEMARVAVEKAAAGRDVRRGSGTSEIAEWIGAPLRDAGAVADVVPAASVRDVGGYDAVIV